MTDILTGLAREQLWTAMEANYIAYFRGFARLPDMEFHEEPDVGWFIANKAPGNHVLGSRFSGQDVDARIAAMLGELRQHARHAEWTVLPTSQPDNLGLHLVAQGLRYEEGGRWMAADLARLPDQAAVPANFRIERVQDERQLQAWLVASAAGFETTVPRAQPYYDAYACLGLAADAAFQHLIGYLDETPVTSSTLLLAEGIAGIFDVSTPPDFRRRGFGRAITLAAMREARARGYRYACLQASEEGFSVYQKLGFVTQFQAHDYVWEQQAL